MSLDCILLSLLPRLSLSTRSASKKCMSKKPKVYSPKQTPLMKQEYSIDEFLTYQAAFLLD